ncbi:MAG: ArsA-related P-loop ATPase [Acidimicrobiales bacterium]
MEPSWLGASRVLFVAGKGGVGSSTVAAAVSLLAARQGADVLLASVDGKPGLGPLLGGRPLTRDEQVLQRFDGAGRVRGRTIPPEQAFGDYLDLKGAGALLRKAASAASLDMVAASTPGLEHLLVLGKIKELDRTKAADLIVVDAPPAGHAAPFLRSARALQDVVGGGPMRQQADEVSAMLADPARSQALLVTLAEETPVNEVIELACDVDDRLGLALAPLVINACWPDRPGLALTPAAAAKRSGITLSAADKAALTVSSRYGAARLAVQREQLARLDERLPLPRVLLPRLTSGRLDAADLDALVDALAVPAAVGATPQWSTS